MKILLVNKFHYRKGGSETYYFTLAQALERRGHEVVFFAMEDAERNMPCEQEKFFVSNASVKGGLRSRVNMVMHIAYSKEAYRKMKALLEAEKPQLVILNLVHKQITLSILDAIQAYDPALPVFWTMHDLIAVCPSYTMLNGRGEICEKCLEGSFWPCVKNRCIKGSLLMSCLSKYEADYIRRRKWYDQVDLFICPSEFYADKLRDAGFTKSPVITLRNPLPPQTGCEINGRDEGYMLYVGRLSQEKGVKTLSDAAKSLHCRLVILGAGPMEEELKAHAAGAANIELAGFQAGEALREYVRRCRCVVLPSEWYENGPYSAMEAMAMGKPLIVSGMGGLPELVEDGKNGYVYRGGASALAACMEKMLTLSQEEYEQMSRCALGKAQQMFSADDYVTQIEKQYGLARARRAEKQISK